MRPLLVLDGVRVDWRRTVLRMAMYLSGVLILALGIVIQTESGMGVASLTCFADALSHISGVSLGTMVSVTYIVYVFAQLVILGREFQPRILLEIGFSVVIGMFTDVFSALIPIHPVALSERVAAMCVSLLLTSFGVSLVVNMGVVPNAPDGWCRLLPRRCRNVWRRQGSVRFHSCRGRFGVDPYGPRNCWRIRAHDGDIRPIPWRMINVMNRLFATRFTRAAFGNVAPLASGLAEARGE